MTLPAESVRRLDEWRALTASVAEWARQLLPIVAREAARAHVDGDSPHTDAEKAARYVWLLAQNMHRQEVLFCALSADSMLATDEEKKLATSIDDVPEVRG